MTHFGDPCIHCATPHDEVSVGPCLGDPAKAVDIAFCSLGIRPDGIERFVVLRSTGELREHYAHPAERFGEHIQVNGTTYPALRYDPVLKQTAMNAGWLIDT